MFRYVVRRILWLLLVLLIVLLITFILMHLTPGGPWDRDKALAPKVIEALTNLSLPSGVTIDVKMV